jgi:hypothetical protein
MTWRALAALAILVAGGVATFAVYTFGWRDDDSNENTTGKPSITAQTGLLRLYKIHGSDAVFDPVTRTDCEVSGEAGIPNLFCTHRGPRYRYQVVFWSDRVEVFDLAAPGEPFRPQFSVPAQLKRAQKYAPR